MVTRREMLLALAATGAAALHRRVTDARSRDPESDFPIPAGACDCHVHVFGDASRFPLAPERSYTPPPAPVDELRRHLQRLHMDRVVIVSPSVYGTNNECALDAISQLGARARGVANVAPETSDTELERLRSGGIRGLRLNFESQGVADPKVAAERFRVAAARAAGLGWHVQINTRLSIVEALEDQLLASPATVVFDHFAQADAARGVEQPGFAALLRLLKAGSAYVKISAAYRISSKTPDYSDVAPLAQTLIAGNPERVLWGSDWPHPDGARRPGRISTDLAPPLPVDDARMLDLLAVWAPDASRRHTILVENPARLYGF